MILYWRHSGHAVHLRVGVGMMGMSHERVRPSQVFLTDEEIKKATSVLGSNWWEDYYHKELLQCIESRQTCDIVIAKRP